MDLIINLTNLIYEQKYDTPYLLFVAVYSSNSIIDNKSKLDLTEVLSRYIVNCVWVPGTPNIRVSMS